MVVASRHFAPLNASNCNGGSKPGMSKSSMPHGGGGKTPLNWPATRASYGFTPRLRCCVSLGVAASVASQFCPCTPVFSVAMHPINTSAPQRPSVGKFVKILPSTS